MRWLVLALVLANVAAVLVLISSTEAAMGLCQQTHSYETCMQQVNR